MEAVDWESSSGGASDKEGFLQDINYDDDEEHPFTSGFISKSQFRYIYIFFLGKLTLYDIIIFFFFWVVTLGYGHNFQER
jgi:hypothetical protein